MRTDLPEYGPLRQLLTRLIKAPAVWSLIWPILLIFGTYSVLSRWGFERINERIGTIDPSRIHLNEAHQYVRSDIVSDVFQSTGLNRLSPLDRQATAKLASAFSSNPWVRHVRSVRKLPQGDIEIQLDYRVPVAAFHLTGPWEWFETLPHPPEDIRDDQYFALDEEGVMLPSSDMTLEDMEDLIHIEVWRVYPYGMEGTPFGDRRVEAAATLAKLLNAVRQRVRVSTISAAGDPRKNLVPQMELILGNGEKVFWGSPPGMELPNERNAKQKLVDLLNGNYSENSDLRFAKEATLEIPKAIR